MSILKDQNNTKVIYILELGNRLGKVRLFNLMAYQLLMVIQCQILFTYMIFK